MESIGAYLLGIFAAAGFLMFTAGELSGILFSFDRPGAQPSDIPGIIGGVLSNPGKPSSGWPKEARGAVPGPVR